MRWRVPHHLLISTGGFVKLLVEAGEYEADGWVSLVWLAVRHK
jgi:hypothetical protein